MAQFARNPDASWTLNYIHADRQNSVTALSDRWGTVVQKRGYGAYGETSSAQMASHPFGYTGRRWVDELGLYYYRARWYDPALGTFLEPDPIGSLDYINLYAYVGLEPGNATDPTGMQAWSCAKTGDGCGEAFTPESRRAVGALASWVGAASEELFWGCLEGGCQGAQVFRGVGAAFQGSSVAGKSLPIGKWVARNERISANARAFQNAVGGVDGQAYRVRGVHFDGFDGRRLIEAKASYGNLIDPASGRFKFGIGDAIAGQAQRQLSAANGTPVVWKVQDQATKAAIEKSFKDAGISGVNIVVERNVCIGTRIATKGPC